MIVAAVSAVYFSWKHSAWVTGHWLAMVPVTGVVLGYLGWQWGFTLAYVTLWIAFIHFVIRGVQSLRASEKRRMLRLEEGRRHFVVMRLAGY